MRGGEALEKHDRRMSIRNSLCYGRQETIAHLAAEYHVNKRGVDDDGEILLLIYPIEPLMTDVMAESGSRMDMFSLSN